MAARRREDVARLVAAARTPETLERAAVATEASDEHQELIAEALIDRYVRLSAAGPKRDPGALLRTKIVELLDVQGLHEIELYRRALRTYEAMPPTSTEVAAPLRAAALVALAHADADVAGYEAVIHLMDADTMTAEPAMTAIRVLGTLGITQPLYALVLNHANGDLVAEALRHMSEIPSVLVTDVLEQLLSERTSDETLIGLVDLVLGHRDEAAFRSRMIDTVAAKASREVIHYTATAMVAARREDAFRALESHPAIVASPDLSAIVGQAAELW